MNHLETVKALTKHWLNKSGELPEDFVFRDISSISTGNVALIGMRRLGKTEYLRFRTKKISNDKIVFLDFDDPSLTTVQFEKKDSNNFQGISNAIEELITLGVTLVLIDEIQRRVDWTIWIKGFIDKYPNVTFVVTGSDALLLRSGRESGLDRFKIIWVGPLTFKEFRNRGGQENIFKYLDNNVFPSNSMNENLELQYSQVYEKQMFNTNLSKRNIKNIIRNITLSPGQTLNGTSLKKALDKEEETNIGNPKTVASILDFLVDSQLVLRLENTYEKERSSKKNLYRYYSNNWNLYKIFTKNNSILELNQDTIPKSGFVFENAVISNIISSLRTSYKINQIGYYEKNKINECDVTINKHHIEIKSFNLFKDGNEDKLFNAITKISLLINPVIIHVGPTKTINDVKVINIEEFFTTYNWKSWLS
ncbi:MAG: ATP-binding protein [Mycoplasmataceae bacterium]|nr:ATP-binding protein [Mycoplasmataceae bacterium]